jgi:hypothetical protein
MPQIVRMVLDESASILIETSDIQRPELNFEEGISRTGTLGDFKQKISNSLTELPQEATDKIYRSLVTFSRSLLGQFQSEFARDGQLNVEIEYGVKFVGGLDIQLASTSAESALKVKLSWQGKT